MASQDKKPKKTEKEKWQKRKRESKVVRVNGKDVKEGII